MVIWEDTMEGTRSWRDAFPEADLPQGYEPTTAKKWSKLTQSAQERIYDLYGEEALPPGVSGPEDKEPKTGIGHFHFEIPEFGDLE